MASGSITNTRMLSKEYTCHEVDVAQDQTLVPALGARLERWPSRERHRSGRGSVYYQDDSFVLGLQEIYPGEKYQEVFDTRSMEYLASSPDFDTDCGQSKESEDPDNYYEPWAPVLD
ncbi:MAG: hypothetical protein Q9209_005988 [Squamulea sp. 1 TL-2023]